MREIQELLEECSARHSHLCPRQVLGVRMGLAGAAALGLVVPQAATGKRLLVIAETDGCFVDGLEVAAGVTVGHRTLRIEDYGKVAATFVDLKSGEALRLAPLRHLRKLAAEYAAGETRPYYAQLFAYQVMPDEEMFRAAPVILTPDLAQIVGRPGVRATCSACGEEIINQREVLYQGLVYCRSCFGLGYYREKEELVAVGVKVEEGVAAT